MKKKVFITGGSGLLALNWANSIKNTHDVTLGVNKRVVALSGVNVLPTDFTSCRPIEQAMQVVNPDVIVHTAGLTSVEACEKDPSLAYAINTTLAGNVAKVASGLKAKLVHISTDHLFSGTYPNADETRIPTPLNVYGETKLAAENQVLQNDPHALVIRTNFFGWGPSYRQSFSDSILGALRANKEIGLFQDVYFTPIFIQFLVKAVHELIEKNEKGIFNVVGDERISKYDFGLRLADAFQLDGSKIKPINFSERSGLTKRPLDMSLSNQKVCKVLGRAMGNIKDHVALLKELEAAPGILEIKKTV